MADVGQCQQSHIQVGHRRKCGVRSWIRIAPHSAQELYPLPVFVAEILISGNEPKSGNVGSVIDASGMVANFGVGIAVGIVLPAHCVQ